jgi:hypothetical protein
VSGDFIEPGIAAGVRYERGDGRLRWQRVEGRAVARHVVGPVTYAGRLDGAAVFGRRPPPQQLLELGENEGLPGYAYKEFGGDRAVLTRGAVAYALPLLRAPVRLFGLTLPSLSPSLAVGAQAGWTDAVGAGTRASLAAFGFRTDSVTGRPLLATRPTNGVKSSIDFTVRVFGNALGLGVARPLERRGRWGFVVSVGQGP